MDNIGRRTCALLPVPITCISCMHVPFSCLMQFCTKYVVTRADLRVRALRVAVRLKSRSSRRLRCSARLTRDSLECAHLTSVGRDSLLEAVRELNHPRPVPALQHRHCYNTVTTRVPFLRYNTVIACVCMQSCHVFERHRVLVRAPASFEGKCLSNCSMPTHTYRNIR